MSTYALVHGGVGGRLGWLRDDTSTNTNSGGCRTRVSQWGPLPNTTSRFRNQVNAVQRSIDRGDVTAACNGLDGVVALARAQSGKNITPAQSNSIIAAVENLSSLLDC